MIELRILQITNKSTIINDGLKLPWCKFKRSVVLCVSAENLSIKDFNLCIP